MQAFCWRLRGGRILGAYDSTHLSELMLRYICFQFMMWIRRVCLLSPFRGIFFQSRPLFDRSFEVDRLRPNGGQWDKNCSFFLSLSRHDHFYFLYPFENLVHFRLSRTTSAPLWSWTMSPPVWTTTAAPRGSTSRSINTTFLKRCEKHKITQISAYEFANQGTVIPNLRCFPHRQFRYGHELI